MPALIDITGQRFGTRVVIAMARSDRTGTHWLVRCDCGKESTSTGYYLRAGVGCSSCSNRRHGHATGSGLTPTYQSWSAMIGRRNGRNRASCYAGGVEMDPRFKSFEFFMSVMGERPDGKTLDRIDGTRGYFPDNMRWATPREQARNRYNSITEMQIRVIRRLLAFGTMTLTSIGSGMGVSRKTVANIRNNKNGAYSWVK